MIFCIIIHLNGKLCIYCGWMLKPDKYEEIYKRLKGIGITLINDVNEYAACHLFSNSCKL